MNELILLEKEFPDIKLATSPTNRVGGQVAKEFKKIPHKRLMLSLGNVYNEDEVTDFDRKIKDVTHEAINTYMGEVKIDGLGMSLIYENGLLQYAVTRGDGVMGEDVTQNVITIKSIPLTVKEKRPFEVRGEVFMPKASLDALNKEGLFSEGDFSNEKIGYKIRAHIQDRVPYTLILGAKEAGSNTVTLKKRGEEKQEVLTLDEFINKLKLEIQNKK